MLELRDTIRLTTSEISDIKEIAERTIAQGRDFDIWRFEGEMGSGKTTLIREICDQMGVEDNVSSPSYGIVNEYRTEKGQTIFHFDFYRVQDLDEAIRIGVEEYFDSGKLCLIEWPERVDPLIPSHSLHIELKIVEGQQREICLKKYE